MITGIVTDTHEAVISITVRGAGGDEQTVPAVIDTGFDGWLSLPPTIIAALRLRWSHRGRAQLADGSTTIFDIFEGIVSWDKAMRRIPIDEAETAPLIGMALLEGFELNMAIRAGGKVKLKKLRTSSRDRGNK